MIVETGVSGYHTLQFPNILNGTTGTYTASVYIKANGARFLEITLDAQTINGSGAIHWYGGAIFNPNTGSSMIINPVASSAGLITASNAIMTALPNGWYKCSVTFTTVNTLTVAPLSFRVANAYTTSNDQIYAGDGVSGFYLWGAQLESGAYATSYIPTTATAVTRQADSLSMSTIGWFNNVEGQLFSVFTPLGAFPGYPQIGLFADGTMNNFIADTLFPTNFPLLEYKQSGSSLFFINNAAISAGVAAKHVAA